MRFIRCNDVYYRGDKCTVSRETVEEIVCYNAVIKRYHWFHYIKKEERERERNRSNHSFHEIYEENTWRRARESRNHL